MEKKYTYLDFANEVIALANGKTTMTAEVKNRVIAKATDLMTAQLNKQAYAKEHPKKSTAKGASEKTLATVANLKGVLNATPKTSAEISVELGIDLSPLQIANAVKFIDGVKSTKVVRSTVNTKGLKAEKLYTAYSIE